MGPFFGGPFFGGGFFGPAKAGGDDAPARKSPHRGWDREEWLKRQERELEMLADIESAYREVMGTAPVPVKQRATEIVEQFAKPRPDKPIELRINWSAMARDYERTQELIALWQEQRERVEEEEILLLL